jgi:hypothetical protein
MKEETKHIQLQASTASSNSTLTFAFDTLGAGRAVVDLYLYTPQVTNAPAVLKLGEGDTTAAYTDIAAFVAGGTGGFTAAASTTATTTTNVYRMDVDMRGRKRYFQLTYTPAVGQGATALTAVVSAELSRLALGGSTAAKQGVNQVVAG